MGRVVHRHHHAARIDGDRLELGLGDGRLRRCWLRLPWATSTSAVPSPRPMSRLPAVTSTMPGLELVMRTGAVLGETMLRSAISPTSRLERSRDRRLRLIDAGNGGTRKSLLAARSVAEGGRELAVADAGRLAGSTRGPTAR